MSRRLPQMPGHFLSSQPDSDATRNFITGMATAKANQKYRSGSGNMVLRASN